MQWNRSAVVYIKEQESNEDPVLILLDCLIRKNSESIFLQWRVFGLQKDKDESLVQPDSRTI